MLHRRNLFAFLIAVLCALSLPTLASAATEPLPGAPSVSEITLVNPKKIMITVHGGAWTGVGQEYMEALRPYAQLWQGVDWTTVNVSYRAGAQSVPDILRIYDLTRARYGRNATVCIAGQSAGAHLAMMVAAYRKTLDCAISEAGPVDLTSLRVGNTQNNAWDGQNFTYAQAKSVYDQLVVPVFGNDAAGISSVSPLDHMADIRARVYMTSAMYDPLIPMYQALHFREVAQQSPNMAGRFDMDLLPQAQPNNEYLWVHATTTQEAAYGALMKEYQTAMAAYDERQANPVIDEPVDPGTGGGNTDPGTGGNTDGGTTDPNTGGNTPDTGTTPDTGSNNGGSDGGTTVKPIVYVGSRQLRAKNNRTVRVQVRTTSSTQLRGQLAYTSSAVARQRNRGAKTFVTTTQKKSSAKTRTLNFRLSRAEYRALSKKTATSVKLTVKQGNKVYRTTLKLRR